MSLVRSRRALVATAAGCLAVTTSAAAETHRLTPTLGHATFAVREAVLTVKPGGSQQDRLDDHFQLFCIHWNVTCSGDCLLCERIFRHG